MSIGIGIGIGLKLGIGASLLSGIKRALDVSKSDTKVALNTVIIIWLN